MRRGKRAGEAASVSSPFLQVLETQRAGPAEYQVVQHLDQLIRERVLSPGDKLPSEIGLAKELNVPRSAVASIYTKLAMFGLVEARPQSGTYLASMSGFAFEGFLKEVMKLASQDMEVEDLRYLYELRQLHEKFVARLAAEKITPAQVEELRAVARDVKERVLSGGESIEADLLFHLKIADIVGRPVLRTMGLIMAASTIRSFFQLADKVPSRDMQARWLDSMAEHDSIVDALASGDPDIAERAVQRHFEKAALFFGVGRSGSD